MGFSRQEYWSGLPCPPPGDLPDPGIKSASPELLADSLPLSHQGSPVIYLLLTIDSAVLDPGLISHIKDISCTWCPLDKQ